MLPSHDCVPIFVTAVELWTTHTWCVFFFFFFPDASVLIISQPVSNAFKNESQRQRGVIRERLSPAPYWYHQDAGIQTLIARASQIFASSLFFKDWGELFIHATLHIMSPGGSLRASTSRSTGKKIAFCGLRAPSVGL